MPQEINFTQFTNTVNQKMNGMKMNDGQKSYVNSQLSSIFTQGDANKNGMLSKTELNSVLGMLNSVMDLAQTEALAKNQEAPKEIKNPKFKGLEDYGFQQHGAKDGVGMITVNGENMIVLVNDDASDYQIVRFDLDKDKQIGTSYKSMDELKTALRDKNNNFGQYSGIESLYDVFIP